MDSNVEIKKVQMNNICVYNILANVTINVDLNNINSWLNCQQICSGSIKVNKFETKSRLKPWPQACRAETLHQETALSITLGVIFLILLHRLSVYIT